LTPGANTSTRLISGLARKMSSRTFRIVNEKGLHARASAKFVEVVEAHDARAEVLKDGLAVSGDSIMGLLMLAASRGTSIEVRTSGAEAGKLADALEALVAARFGEEY
jgi:phosphocarrier protein HPr